MHIIVNKLLRQALSRKPSRGYKLNLETWSSTPSPGVDLFDRDRLLDLLREDESRRY